MYTTYHSLYIDNWVTIAKEKWRIVAMFWNLSRGKFQGGLDLLWKYMLKRDVLLISGWTELVFYFYHVY